MVSTPFCSINDSLVYNRSVLGHRLDRVRATKLPRNYHDNESNNNKKIRLPNGYTVGLLRSDDGLRGRRTLKQASAMLQRRRCVIGVSLRLLL